MRRHGEKVGAFLNYGVNAMGITDGRRIAKANFLDFSFLRTSLLLQLAADDAAKREQAEVGDKKGRL